MKLRDLISAAAEAEEFFDVDALERFAEEYQCEKEEKQSKEQRVKELNITDTFDYALPQGWVNACDNFLFSVHAGASGVSNLIKGQSVVPHFVWLYDKQAKIFGRPFPLTTRGKRMLKFLHQHGIIN